MLFVAFTPDIIIPGAPTAGDEFNIKCTLAIDGVVGILESIRLPMVSLSFIDLPGGGVTGNLIQDDLAYIRPHFFNPITTDDTETYTCVAAITDTSLSKLFFSSSSGTIQIKS